MKFRKKFSLKMACIAMFVMLILYFINQISIVHKLSYNILKFRQIQLVESVHNTNEKAYERLRESQITNILFKRQGNFTFPSIDDYVNSHESYNPFYSAFPLFPFETDRKDDRIWNQMRYIPKNSQQADSRYKHILLYYGQHDVSNSSFSHCPVNKCFVSGERESATTADVILWMHSIEIPDHQRPLGQIWMVYLLESPFHTPKFADFEHLGSNYSINWTATYRQESTLVAPYFKYTPYDLTGRSYYGRKKTIARRNYASGKTKMVAWFVSNCGSFNNRFEFVEILQKYITVDIYGQCGSLVCPRSNPKSCFEMLSKDYKFYLAFENSNCHNYITEKFFLNGLSNDVVPIVMGAPAEDYYRVSPPHSFIHVDEYATIKELADYLLFLNNNNTAYNEYLAWKGSGLVDTNSYFWCRLCMMAHEGDNIQSTFPNVFGWWFDKTTCTNASHWKINNKI